MARVPSLFNLIYSLLRKKNWRSENLFWYRYLRSVERSVSFQWFVSNLKQLNYTKSKHGHGLTRCRASNAHKRGIPIQLANEQCYFNVSFMQISSSRDYIILINEWYYSSPVKGNPVRKKNLVKSCRAVTLRKITALGVEQELFRLEEFTAIVSTCIFTVLSIICMNFKFDG